jgi:hypothetical protein
MISNDQMHELLTRQQAADILRVKPQTLAAWACVSGPERNLPVFKIGRLVRYLRADIDAFIENGKQSLNEKKTRRSFAKPEPPEITRELREARYALNAAGQEGLTPRQLHRDNRRSFPTSDMAEVAFNQLMQLNLAEKLIITKATGRQKTAWRMIKR